MPASNFDDIFLDEVRELRPDLAFEQKPTLEQLYHTLDHSSPPMAALCLSGGGIRSASFALGVLQGLARFGLLGQFHYLSTVSGGGYIGSWLSAWRHHAQSDNAVLAAIDRTRSQAGKEAEEIRGLRSDSNYLTPKLGLLSADTWAVIALIVRNLLLNWLIFVPLFMGVLFVPWLCFDLLTALSGKTGFAVPLLLLGLAFAVAGFAAASFGRRAKRPRLTDESFVLLVLLPVFVAAICFTGGAASLAGSLASKIGYKTGAIAGVACYGLASALASWRLGHWSAANAVARADALKDLITWFISGAIAGVLLILGMRLAASLPDTDEVWLTRRTVWLTVLGSSWTMLSVFGGELAYVGLRSYARTGDMDREWLGRAAGWLTACAVSWALFAVVALLGPPLLQYSWQAFVGWISAAGISGLVAVLLGNSTKTAATTALQVGKSLSLTQLASAAAVIFAVVMSMGLAAADAWLSDTLSTSIPLPWLIDGVLVVVLLCLSVAVSWLINVNRFSLHAMYRNRLVRAFLGNARATARATDTRKPDPFTGFDLADNVWMKDLPTSRLLHVVNITLNVVSTKERAWQERKAEPFTMTPLACGNPNVGYRRTGTFGSADGITLGTAMAISGAAVSPNMGYHSSPLLGFLLMLFNVRLGWWLGNPRHGSYHRQGPTFSIVPILEELAGQTTDQGRWVYLSDGGHFENLGLYEMVRRRCRAIVISDAGCDPECAFEDLGNAVRKIYIDLGVSIEFEKLGVTKRETPPGPGVYCAIGRIVYPGTSEPGWLLYIKPGYHGNEPADIRSYATAHETFPHETTANQWFSESQFESYRGLGAHVAELICSGGAPVPATVHPDPIDLDKLRLQAERYLAAMKNGVADQVTREEAHRCNSG